MTGIIAAMDCEAETLRAAMTDRLPAETFGGIKYYRGTIGHEPVVIATCGIGKVFAAACAVGMILKYAPDRIINTGVAGAVGGDVKIMDTVVATSLVQHDMDTSPIGDPVGMLSSIRKIFLPTDETLSAQLAACVESCGGSAVRGVIATGDQFIASHEKKQQIFDRFGALAAEMEGGAIAHICYLYGVPCAVLRTMSDGADGTACYDFAGFVVNAAEISANVLLTYLRSL